MDGLNFEMENPAILRAKAETIRFRCWIIAHEYAKDLTWVENEKTRLSLAIMGADELYNAFSTYKNEEYRDCADVLPKIYEMIEKDAYAREHIYKPQGFDKFLEDNQLLVSRLAAPIEKELSSLNDSLKMFDYRVKKVEAYALDQEQLGKEFSEKLKEQIKFYSKKNKEYLEEWRHYYSERHLYLMSGVYIKIDVMKELKEYEKAKGQAKEPKKDMAEAMKDVLQSVLGANNQSQEAPSDVPEIDFSVFKKKNR